MKPTHLLLFALLASSAAAAEQWTVNPQAVDYVTSERVKAAEGLDEKRNKLSIYRTADGRVRLTIKLSDSSFDQLAKSGKILALRADQSKAYFYEYQPTPQVQDTYVYDKTMRTILWHGKGRAPYYGTLRDLMDAKTIYLRVFLDGGGYTDTKMDMLGAQAVIAQALNVPSTVTDQERDNSRRSRELGISASNKCQTRPSYSACSNNIIACIQEDEGAFDELVYRICLKGKGINLD